MPIKVDPRFVGRAWLTPDRPVVAGEYGTWTFTYEVGGAAVGDRTSTATVSSNLSPETSSAGITRR